MARMPAPQRTLSAELERLKERIQALENRSPFFGTGMHPNGSGGIDSDNFAAGSAGYSFKADGDAEFNQITLRGGIIGNDALTNPVKPDVSTNAASGFALTTVYTTVMSRTWALPAGFNVAQISGTAKAYAVNTSAGDDYLRARSRIVRVSDGAEITGADTPTLAPAGGVATSAGLGVGWVEMAAGDSVRMEVQVKAEFGGWAAHSTNFAEWTGSLSWYRI